MGNLERLTKGEVIHLYKFKKSKKEELLYDIETTKELMNGYIDYMIKKEYESDLIQYEIELMKYNQEIKEIEDYAFINSIVLETEEEKKANSTINKAMQKIKKQ